jgi:hypothetical protein
MLDEKSGLKVCILCLALTVALAAGCQKTKYAMWEKLGKEKRHLLKSEVEQVAGEQEEASRQFQDALSRIKAMYGFDGKELEKVYDRLNDDYIGANDQAEDVRERIRNVEQIAKDLFAEWEREAGEISNATLKAKSKQSLRETQSRYRKLHAAMKKAEAGMDPVLVNLKDYVLYLKHNLNAQAVGALKSEAESIDQDISVLVRDMNESIRQAEEFLEEFES